MKRTFDPNRGIKCPRCHSTHNSVSETRQAEDGIKRTRVCACGQRFVTNEKVEKIPESSCSTTIGSDRSESSS